MVSMMKIISMVTLATLAPMASLAPVAPIAPSNGDVFHITHMPLHVEINEVSTVIGAVSFIDTNGVNDANKSAFAPIDHIVNVATGAIDTIGINEANGSPMLPLAPVTPMV